MQKMILGELQKLSALLLHMQQDVEIHRTLEAITAACLQAFKQEKKILLAGNGGSAADSQHLAAEFVSRLRYDRPGLAAIALTTDTSALTAIGNDYSFEHLFSRQIEALGQAQDIFIGISTSGKSPNILAACRAARAKKMITIGFTGMHTEQMRDTCDIVLSIPSTETPKIQECHITLGHIICAMVEESLFGAEYNPARRLTEDVA